eukprot:tig00000923_g5466.t1
MDHFRDPFQNQESLPPGFEAAAPPSAAALAAPSPSSSGPPTPAPAPSTSASVPAATPYQAPNRTKFPTPRVALRTSSASQPSPSPPLASSSSSPAPPASAPSSSSAPAAASPPPAAAAEEVKEEAGEVDEAAEAAELEAVERLLQDRLTELPGEEYVALARRVLPCVREQFHREAFREMRAQRRRSQAGTTKGKRKVTGRHEEEVKEALRCLVRSDEMLAGDHSTAKFLRECAGTAVGAACGLSKEAIIRKLEELEACEPELFSGRGKKRAAPQPAPSAPPRPRPRPAPAPPRRPLLRGARGDGSERGEPSAAGRRPLGLQRRRPRGRRAVLLLERGAGREQRVEGAGHLAGQSRLAREENMGKLVGEIRRVFEKFKEAVLAQGAPAAADLPHAADLERHWTDLDRARQCGDCDGFQRAAHALSALTARAAEAAAKRAAAAALEEGAPGPSSSSSLAQRATRSWPVRGRPGTMNDEEYLVCEDAAGGREAVRVPAFNAVDEEPFPGAPDFEYVPCMDLCWLEQNCPEALENDKELLAMSQCECHGRSGCGSGCSCLVNADLVVFHLRGCVPSGGGNCSLRCAERHPEFRAPYEEGGRLRRDVEYVMMQECQAGCACVRSNACPHRVVGRCLSRSLRIFKTRDGRGWGVRADEDLPEGVFVCEYGGELVTNAEAERRAREEYEPRNLYYLWDLDYAGEAKFVIDATRKGNVGRFINHSCEPNLCMQKVLVDSMDVLRARLAFFTSRPIRRGEELTIDYDPPQQGARRQGRSKKHKREGANYKMPCRCGAERCRKYLFRITQEDV